MTSRDFCFWLQGFFELNGSDLKKLGPVQVEMIKRHLALVFIHDIDPSMGSQEQQDHLNAVHHGGKPPYKPTKIQFGGIDPKTGLQARC